MSDAPPLIIVETAAVNATAEIAEGYSVEPLPANANADLSLFKGRKVILWPDATQESRKNFKHFAEQLTDLCEEIKLIVPNGKPAGWNIAEGVKEGLSWADIAAWAKASMIIFGQGEFPRLVIEPVDIVPPSVEAIWDQVGIARTERGVINNVDNIVRLLAGWDKFKNIIWFDEFYGRYFTTFNGAKPAEWRDIDDIKLTVILQREFGFPRISEQTVASAVRCRASQCVRNEPKDWLYSLKWDGKSRIDSFFPKYLGAIPTGYTAAVGRNFWIGMIARIYRPGCQLDNMVILEGKQGIYKSRALEAIGGKWYMEASEEITSKDFFVALAGKLIIEIADLDSFSRADTNRIKKVVTCRVDRYRQPYARASEDHPRQSIFVGTTNEQHYLKDATGARRFWPIQCGKIDLELIRRSRDQLFAEAVTRYIAGEDWYKVPDAATSNEQEERRQYDEWENIVGVFLHDSCQQETTMAETAAAVGVDKAHLDINVQRRLGAILRRMGWASKTARRVGYFQRVWVQLPDPEPRLTTPDLPLSVSPALSNGETV